MLSVKEIWQNRRHYKLQIFGAATVVSVLAFSLNLASIGVSHARYISNQISSNVYYTKTFKMSKTGTNGKVWSIYTDTAHQQCLMLLQFESMTDMPMRAEKYEMFFKNANIKGELTTTPTENVKGRIYVIGTTGYMYIYLYSDTPFTQNIRNLTLRSYDNKVKTQAYDENASSFQIYNQGSIYFNPVGSDAQTIDFLENHELGGTFDVEEMYYNTVAVNTELEIKKNLQADVDGMYDTTQKLIEETGRLKGTGDGDKGYDVVLPEVSPYIHGDTFQYVDTDADGLPLEQPYYSYIPDVILPGGTDFVWRGVSADNGYLASIPEAKGMTFNEYMLFVENSKILSDTGHTFSQSDVINQRDEYTFSDGTPIVLSNKNTDNALMNAVVEEINAYIQYKIDYFKYKSDYQTNLLPQLLYLEENINSISSIYTVTNDDVLFVW